MTEVYKIVKDEATAIKTNSFFRKTFIILEISKLQLMRTKIQ